MSPFPSLAPPPRGSGVAFVTGAAGFIGRHVTAALKDAGWRVAGLSRSEVAPDGLQLTAADAWVSGRVSLDGLARATAMLGRPDLLVHAAGGASVGASLADPNQDFDRTVASLGEVLNFLRGESPATRLVLLSSAAVYGAANHGPIREDAAARPISPYGLHKHLAEALALGWARLFDLDVAVLRLFSVYGPGIRKQLLWDVARRLCGEPAAIELSGAGDELRDFLYIDDAVRLIGLLAAGARPDQPVLINGGSGEGFSVRQVAQHLCDVLGVGAQIVFNGARRAGDPPSLVADITAARALGFRPLVRLDEGLAQFAAWARSETAASVVSADWRLERRAPVGGDAGA